MTNQDKLDVANEAYNKDLPRKLEIDRLAGIMSDAVHDKPWKELKEISPATADAEMRRAGAIYDALNPRK